MKETINNLKKTWIYVKDNKSKLIKFIITNIIEIIISVIIPVLSAKLIVNLTNNMFKELLLVALLIYLIENTRNIINYFSRNYGNIVYRETLKKLEIDLGKNILKINNKTLYQKGSGMFIERLSSDTSRIADAFTSISGGLTPIITDIGIFIAMFIINKYFFMFILFSILILYLIEKKRITIRNIEDKKYRKKRERVSSIAGELVRGATDIKMLNSESSFLEEFKTRISEMNNKRYEMNNVDRKYNLLEGFLSDSQDILTIIILIILISKSYLTIATAIILYNYSSRISSVSYYFSSLLTNIKDFNLSANRVFEIIDNDKFEKEIFGTKHIKKVEGNFSFDNVTFSYNDRKVLKNLTFDIKANETVAFVGKSGAGKTTIFNLLCKLYIPNSGKITIDGIDIQELDKDSIRGNITIISQNPYIFNMSIKDNLRLVKSDITDKEIKRVCQIACLDDFINELPNKYDEIIGEGGVNLSGGQKQRLAIARALAQKTEIILFDEATSALDNETQEKITTAINNLKGEYTILIIAHRLSTIKNASRILFLEDGKILSSGTHKELLDTCSSYKRLYESEIKNNN